MLKEEFRVGQWIASISAHWYRTVSRRLNNISIVDGRVEIDDREIRIIPNLFTNGFSRYPHSFDIVVKSVEKDVKPIITIAAGYVNVQGDAPHGIPETDLELEINKPLIYVYIEKPDLSAGQILQQEGAPRPQTVPGTWRKVLYEVATDVNGYPGVLWDRRPDFDIGSPI